MYVHYTESYKVKKTDKKIYRPKQIYRLRKIKRHNKTDRDEQIDRQIFRKIERKVE